MSKYFNQTQQTVEIGNGDHTQPGVLDQLLGTVKEGNALSVAVGQTRLEGCRKITIARNGSAPQLISTVTPLNVRAAESYRALRTRLMRIQSGTGLRSVTITSAMQGDGKTVTSANLALCFAQLSGFRTLVIDADLRTHGLSKLFHLNRGVGLGEILAGSTPHEEAICATDFPNLYVVGAGNNTTAPAELLAGTNFKEFIGWASECFKLIIVDSPPLPTIADAELISAACDGVLMVVRALRTPRELLESAATQLDQKKFLGVVYNGANQLGKYGSYPDYLQVSK